jgi:hypothetical protein
MRYLILIVTLLVISNVHWAGAEDDCAMPTWKVQPINTGVLCIGEGF